MKAPELKEKLHESEKLIQEMTVTWEEKLRKTEEIATVCMKLCLNQHRRSCDHTVVLPVSPHRSVRNSWRAWASPWRRRGSK